ncbi:MAG: hypothetical protein IH586_01680, partial [Anaerolineaceae bacterium]|nr:hypothetical protein [Anaerolineaceae bacterium]
MPTNVEIARRKIISFTPFLILCLFGVLIYLRDTRFFLTPRFWAEEGSLHFAYSFSHPWWQALFQPQVGYLNFWPNLATLIAKSAPLEIAPFVTTILALVIQLAPLAFILWSRSPLWSEWWRKLLGVALAFFVPLSVEGWLNTINSYTFFGAITFLILLEEAPSGLTRRWIYFVLLALGGLAGTLSCFLIPFFLFCAITEKNKERWIQTIILGLCAVFQLAIILFSQDARSIGDRFSFLGIASLGYSVWLQTITLYSLGFERALSIGRSFSSLA